MKKNDRRRNNPGRPKKVQNVTEKLLEPITLEHVTVEELLQDRRTVTPYDMTNNRIDLFMQEFLAFKEWNGAYAKFCYLCLFLSLAASALSLAVSVMR